MDTNQLFNPNLPPEISAEANTLNRRQMLMQALLSKGMSPIDLPQNYGRLASPVSPLAGILPLLQVMTASKGLDRTDKAGGELAKKYNDSIAQTMLAAQQARTGSPGTEPVPATGPTNMTSPSAGTPGTAPSGGNPDLANALLVQHPVTRTMGLDMMKKNMELQMFRDAFAKYKAGGGGAAGGGTGAGAGPSAMGVPLDLALASDISGVGKGYLENIAKENTPITQREGDIVRLQPDGSMKSVFSTPKGGIAITRNAQGQAAGAAEVPGYGKAAGDIAGQEAGAKAKAVLPYELVPVEQAAGGTVQTPKSTLLGPQAAATQAAPLPAVSRGEQATPKPEGVWKTVPRRFIPQGIGQSTYNKTIAQEQGQQAVKLSGDLGTSATAANQRKALNDQSMELVDKAETGPLATQIADVKSFLIKFVPGVTEKSFNGTVEANQALSKDLINAATQTAKSQYGSRITQSEVMLQLKRGSPSGDMVKGAIKYLIASDSAKAQYQMDMANHFGQYMQMGGDPSRFEAWHSKAFPVTDYYKGIGLAPGKTVEPNPPLNAKKLPQAAITGTPLEGPKGVETPAKVDPIQQILDSNLPHNDKLKQLTDYYMAHPEELPK